MGAPHVPPSLASARARERSWFAGAGTGQTSRAAQQAPPTSQYARSPTSSPACWSPGPACCSPPRTAPCRAAFQAWARTHGPVVRDVTNETNEAGAREMRHAQIVMGPAGCGACPRVLPSGVLRAGGFGACAAATTLLCGGACLCALSVRPRRAVARGRACVRMGESASARARRQEHLLQRHVRARSGDQAPLPRCQHGPRGRELSIPRLHWCVPPACLSTSPGRHAPRHCRGVCVMTRVLPTAAAAVVQISAI